MRGMKKITRMGFLVAAAAFASAIPAHAEVSVRINIGPPPIVVAEPPAVVMIPQSQVHFVPDPSIDVFFYGGYWWSPRGERWYRARAYNGPWVVIERHRVPRAVVYVPRDYRVRYEREPHVPYGQWKKDRARWDRENRKAHRKWEREREREWREEHREHRKEERREEREERRDDRRNDHEKHGKHGR